MTTSNASTAPRRRLVAPVAAIGAVVWIALGAVLLFGADVPAVLLVLIVVAVAATAFAIVGFVRARPAVPPAPLVTGLLAPMIALAAMTPLFAVGGALVFGIVAFVFAAELTVLAILSAAGRRHG